MLASVVVCHHRYYMADVVFADNEILIVLMILVYQLYNIICLHNGKVGIIVFVYCTYSLKVFFYS